MARRFRRATPFTTTHADMPQFTAAIPIDFDALLSERYFAREQHALYCELCNEPDDETGRLDSYAPQRDRWYARLQALDAAIEERCATERAEEEA